VKICVLGAGSLGSAIGGRLAEAGHSVCLINRNQSFVDAVRARGLRLLEEGRERSVGVEAARTPEGLAPVDLVIVLVKSFHTREAAEAARNLVGPDTMVMSLQNGLGHEDILSEVFGRAHVLAGKTYVGGQMTEPGLILTGVRGKETIFGELDGALSPRMLALQAAFEAAGMTAVASPNIMGAIWDKLLINVATGAVTAITGLVYGDLYQTPEVEAVGLEAVKEAMTVAAALRIRLETQAPVEAWRKAGNGLPYQFKTSMLQSLEKGSITEIDFVNGAVVRAGAKAGVPTPVNATLVGLVKGVERAMILRRGGKA